MRQFTLQILFIVEALAIGGGALWLVLITPGNTPHPPEAE